MNTSFKQKIGIIQIQTLHQLRSIIGHHIILLALLPVLVILKMDFIQLQMEAAMIVGILTVLALHAHILQGGVVMNVHRKIKWLQLTDNHALKESLDALLELLTNLQVLMQVEIVQNVYLGGLKPLMEDVKNVCL
jgi:hypothetical protein